MVKAKVGLRSIADGFANPVFLTCPPGSRDLFVVDQIGKVFVVHPDGAKDERPFLDLSRELVELNPNYDERGLLGLAFHPRFRTERRFYVFYSAPLRKGAPDRWNCTNHLVEYRVSADRPLTVDLGSRRVILSIDKPQMNHNGGHIAFGPDGFLYVPLGDGGGENDHAEGHDRAVGNAQDTNSLLGKILRIDVDSRSEGREYGIPRDNPFAGGGGSPEIYAYGLRNPYHIAFDAGGGRELFASDAGQVRWEEVNIIVRGGNYGWNIKEGRHYFDPADNMANRLVERDEGPIGLIDPIIDYPNLANRTGGFGSVVIGGYVYRGKNVTYLQGRYVFGDFTGTAGKPDGRLFVATPPVRGDGGWTMEELAVDGKDDEKLGEYLLSFGQDGDGELYVLSSSTEGPEGKLGNVHMIVPSRG